MARKSQAREELEVHLEEQLGFLRASSAAFDTGFESEAKRLAVAIRVLVHDSKHSRSLLGQLGLKGRKFYDTALPFDPKNVLTQSGLVMFALGPRTRPIAPLDSVPLARIPAVPFPRWWDKVVFVDAERRKLSRKELILTCANQDGGAHVDPKLDEVYSDLSRRNSLAWKVGPPDRPMGPPEKAAIRQIAHEVLKTFVPGYHAKPELAADELQVGGASLEIMQPEPPAVRASSKPGRNEPCPCGSGRKFKKCHGARGA